MYNDDDTAHDEDLKTCWRRKFFLKIECFQICKYLVFMKMKKKTYFVFAFGVVCCLGRVVVVAPPPPGLGELEGAPPLPPGSPARAVN